MLSLDGWTARPNIWELVERMFYGRMIFLTPTLSTLEPMKVLIFYIILYYINLFTNTNRSPSQLKYNYNSKVVTNK